MDAGVERENIMKPIKLETAVKPDGASNHIRWMTDTVKAAVQATLDDINGRATSFTVCHANKVYELSCRAEAYLNNLEVPVADRGGAKLTYRPAGPSANSYKHGVVSTEITLRRKSGSEPIWFLDAVKRGVVYPKNKERFNVTISDSGALNAVKRTLAAFGRDVVPREILAPADDAAIRELAA
jgi:hypothetical protein